jgi:pyruvate dehydrogenase E1 component alpha subunit
MSPASKKKTSLSQKELINLYKKALFYRRFEERVQTAYTQQKFSGFCHLHIGQEAICVGLGACLQKEDHLISGYRSHTLAIEKGIPAESVFAELLGRKTGCCQGKGGSMHMFSKEHRFMGGHGIVGGQAPLAVGAGFAIKYEDKDEIIVCLLGDAAMNQGQVFEAMNMAATWNLPVLFLIENNQYGMGTDIKRTTSVDSLSKRALAFDMQNKQIDGMNIINFHQELKPIVDSIRKTKKPYLLEAMTYRYKGHSVSDPATYRTKEEVLDYQKKDPLIQLADHLKAKKWSTEEELKEWNDELKKEIKELEKRAETADFSDESSAWQHVFAD